MRGLAHVPHVLVPVSLAVALTVRRVVMMAAVCVRVPFFLDEVDRMTAGIVFAAMLVPVLRVAGRYSQIDRLLDYPCGRLVNYDGLGVNDRRTRHVVADVDASVKARLTDADRYANIGCCGCGHRNGADGESRCRQ